MSTRVKIILAVVLVASTITVLTIGVQRYVERQRTSAEINRLRDELYRARVASDRCRSSLVTSEASLQTLSLTIDSLRARVDSFEALGGGRVPSGRYEEYLVLFDSYNDSVASWEARSERLQTAETSCRSVIEEHNALSDSIQSRLEGAGIETG